MPLAKGRSDPVTIGIIAIVFGGGLIYNGIKNFRKSRKIQDTARIDIGSAPLGLVEVEGYAWPAIQAMPAVCGRNVVYYHYKVQQYVRRGKSSYWETKHEFNFGNPFYVMDSSGICLVHPQKNGLEVREEITKLSGYAESTQDLSAMGHRGV